MRLRRGPSGGNSYNHCKESTTVLAGGSTVRWDFPKYNGSPTSNSDFQVELTFDDVKRYIKTIAKEPAFIGKKQIDNLDWCIRKMEEFKDKGYIFVCLPKSELADFRQWRKEKKEEKVLPLPPPAGFSELELYEHLIESLPLPLPTLLK